MNMALFRKEMKSNYMMLLIFFGVLTMYSVMIILMFDPQMGDSLQTMAESMPELFAAFGMSDVGETLLEFMANYLYGFLFVAFPAVFLILLSTRLVAKYVDDGSLVYLLAAPQKRCRVVVTQAIFLLVSLLILMGSQMAVILAASEVVFPGELDIPAFLSVNVGWYGVLVFFGGICFLCSCLFNNSRHATGVGAGIVVYSLLMQMISQVGEKFEWLEYATPLTLFDIEGFLSGTAGAWAKCGILYAVGVGCIVIGIYQFCNRDLPI